MGHLLVLYCILIASWRAATAWVECESGGICPDGNTCCEKTATATVSTKKHHGSVCISGSVGDIGMCCNDEAVTGCHGGFTCANGTAKENLATSYYCERLDKTDFSLPNRVPRYTLCLVPAPVLQTIHGFSVVDSNPNKPKLAYLSTMGAIDSTSPDILNLHARVQTVIIVVHGSSRNPNDYICCTNAALPSSEQFPTNSTTMLIAPWFLAPRDNVTEVFNFDGSTSVPLYWFVDGPHYHTWRFGANALNANLSSYTAMDTIVNHLVQDFLRFPLLERIIVAGHSAGGQLVHRWAVLSGSHAFAASLQHDFRSRPVAIRVVVANPKSYCYLDGRRFIDGEFRLLVQDEKAECLPYNKWQWGLDDGPFLSIPYRDEAFALAGGRAKVVGRYAMRDVVYLSGELDILPNGNCMAQLQGAYRKERSERYFASLKKIYGWQPHRRLVVSQVHHDHCLIFQSPEGHRAFFESYEQSYIL